MCLSTTSKVNSFIYKIFKDTNVFDIIERIFEFILIM